jgi:hypothetical protein
MGACTVPDLLAADPGAWNIIGWMLVLAVIGAAVLWVVTTLFLRVGGADPSPAPPTGSDDG